MMKRMWKNKIKKYIKESNIFLTQGRIDSPSTFKNHKIDSPKSLLYRESILHFLEKIKIDFAPSNHMENRFYSIHKHWKIDFIACKR